MLISSVFESPGNYYGIVMYISKCSTYYHKFLATTILQCNFFFANVNFMSNVNFTSVLVLLPLTIPYYSNF